MQSTSELASESNSLFSPWVLLLVPEKAKSSQSDNLFFGFIFLTWADEIRISSKFKEFKMDWKNILVTIVLKFLKFVGFLLNSDVSWIVLVLFNSFQLHSNTYGRGVKWCKVPVELELAITKSSLCFKLSKTRWSGLSSIRFE